LVIIAGYIGPPEVRTKIKGSTLLVGIIALSAWVCLICKYRSLVGIIALEEIEDSETQVIALKGSKTKDISLKGSKTKDVALKDSEVQDQSVETDKKYKKYEKYIPADVEDYIMNNFKELNYDEEHDANKAKGCKIWESLNATNQENYDKLQGYVKDLEDYNKAISDFTSPFPDVMEVMHERGDTLDGWSSVCEKLQLHPDGIEALFPSKQISLTSAGYVEPLLTPMRHHEFCKDARRALMRMDYMVHDFESMCMKLKPKSRRVLIDMGASLSFHGTGAPIVSLLNLYEKFGFNFDHIYAFEVTAQDPTEVYTKLLPKKYFPSYHWINTGTYIFCFTSLCFLCNCFSLFMIHSSDMTINTSYLSMHLNQF
jgi:hypothetical protein